MKRRKSIWAGLLMSVMLLGHIGLYGGLAFADSNTGNQEWVPPLENDWVIISTREQLVYVDQNQEQFVNKQIRLDNDIDLTGVIWVPLGGNDYAPFSGTFDGQGHTISGLVINGDTRLHVGFFGEANGTIRDISLEVNITGGSSTGAMAGLLSGGSAEGVYTTGIVTSLIPQEPNKVIATGGITGMMRNASINRSSSSADITVGWGYNMYGAGISGYNSSSSITNSYFDGQIRNVNDVGNSYIFTSGIGAYFFDTSGTKNEIRNTYYRGLIHPNNPGWYTSRSAIAGYANSTNIFSSYFDKETSGVTVGVDSSYNSDTIEATGKTTAEMRDQANFIDWDFDRTWNIHPNVNDGSPYLRPQVLTEELPYAVQGESYSFKLAGFDGSHTGLIWSAAGLPAGLNLSPSGELQGIPAPEPSGNTSYTVLITAADAAGATAKRSFQLEIKARAPELVESTLQPGTLIGTTAFSAMAHQAGDSFAYIMNRTESAPPLYGTVLPIEAVQYVLGSDIPGVMPGQTIDFYEIDSDHRIQSWRRFVLETEHIRQVNPVVNIRDVAPISDIYVSYGTALTDVDTPEYVDVTLEDHTMHNMPVTWDKGTPVYNATQPGIYVFNGTIELGVGLANPDGLSATLNVIVQDPVPTEILTGIVLDKSNYRLKAGSTHSTVTKAVYSSSRQETVTDGVLYMSSRPEIASVDNNGTVTGLTPGQAIITASYADFEAETTVDVWTDPPASPNPSHPVEPSVPSPSSTPSMDYPVEGSVTNPNSLILFCTQEGCTAKLGKEFSIDVPKGATERGFTLHVNKIEPDGTMVPASMKLISSIFELVKDDEVNLLKPVTLHLQYESSTLDKNHRAALFQYEETVGEWVEVNGTVNGNMLTATVDHFSRFAIFSVEDDASSNEPSGKPTENPTITYSDATGHWAIAAIIRAAELQIVDGFPDGSFRPDQSITRAEFSVMMARALGMELSGPTTGAIFGDRESFPAWATLAIQQASSAKLINGYEDGTFRPHALISRAEMITILMRTQIQTMDVNAHTEDGKPSFTDLSSIPAWAFSAVEEAGKLGLLKGQGNGKIEPDAKATRAEAVTMILRLIHNNDY